MELIVLFIIGAVVWGLITDSGSSSSSGSNSRSSDEVNRMREKIQDRIQEVKDDIKGLEKRRGKTSVFYWGDRAELGRHIQCANRHLSNLRKLNPRTATDSDVWEATRVTTGYRGKYDSNGDEIPDSFSHWNH